MITPALKINEIFYSIQGESLFVGNPTVFIRTATCNMRCKWCDTRYAFWEGHLMTLSEILAEVRKHPTKYVCVTGGEPLGQKASIPLMQALVDQGYTVSLETGGGFSVKDVPPEVVKIVDIKCPGSGETDAMEWTNLDLTSPTDQFKFVVASREDFDWAMNLIEEKKLSQKSTILVSPVHESVSKQELSEWVLSAKQPITLQFQLHKEIWGQQRGV